MDTVESYLRTCPARQVLETLANKWALLVLGALRQEDGPLRFSELRRQLEGVTQKMLTQTLRLLERDGLVRRDVYPTVPPRVEYSVTALGTEAGDLMNALGHWAEARADEIMAARESFDTRPAPEPIR
ncbi:helix-turn-helix domain-containing protein [Amycolatopsis sp. GM8]|uniref:winged helix-turn-helix transcriptional regulator n=1 Tax=Amycolatopsis sp. GM8 TaxID=2896530 RepID=UPI001F26E44B|nr:helix-turn-helix domain-containing protein [Amycolatopsis sp. GM8]